MQSRFRPNAPTPRAGFTLLDVLVAMAVITLLIALLTPGLSRVQETSRRVVCASNLRQFGLGIQMYADDYRGQLPPSVFLNRSAGQESEMMTIRLPVDRHYWVSREGWDGLGVLYATEYLKAPGLYYCPSHSGNHPFSRYEEVWQAPSGEIVGNYQFRGEDGDNQTNLFLMEAGTALVADGMRTQDDYNHRVGMNVLRSGLSVGWMPDANGQIMSMLAENDELIDTSHIEDAWHIIDGHQR